MGGGPEYPLKPEDGVVTSSKGNKYLRGIVDMGR